jgi:hypothetical protein
MKNFYIFIACLLLGFAVSSWLNHIKSAKSHEQAYEWVDGEVTEILYDRVSVKTDAWYVDRQDGPFVYKWLYKVENIRVDDAQKQLKVGDKIRFEKGKSWPAVQLQIK